MKKHIIYLGLNDKDSHQQEIDTISAFKIATNLCCKYYDGATIKEATGIYKHDDGTIVIEKSLEISILFAEDSKTAQLIQELKQIFNQESVALQKIDDVVCNLV